jgi:hypothetical protein
VTRQTRGLVAKVTPATRRALDAVAFQITEGERRREMPSFQCLVGQFLEAFIRERWEDWFVGITYDDFCRRERKGERVDLKQYRFLAQPDEKGNL